MIIEEGKVRDFLRKAKNSYDYYTGKRSTKYDFNETAPLSVIKATEFKPYMNDGTKYKALMDRDALKVKVEVDATNVGKKLAPLLNPKTPKPKDENEPYPLKYYQSYDKSRKTINLIFPITNERIIQKLKNEEDFGQSNSSNDSTNVNKDVKQS